MKIFSATLKGTTTVSQGTTNLSGSFTGSYSGSVAGIAGDISDYSSSVALRATSLEAASGSFSTRTTSLEAASGSFSTRTTAIERVYATTGSNTFTAAQIIQGTLTAQTLVVQTVTSSVLFSTGSNKIGSSLSNVQELTGSVGITGSLAINGTGAIVGSGTANYVPKFTASGTIGNSLIFDNGTAVGIGTSSPGSLFDITNVNSTAYDSTNSLISGQTMRIANTSTTSGISANLLFIATGGGGGNGIGTISGVNTGTGSLALTFATRDAGGSIAERMRITSAGSVLIGGTSSDGYGFQVYGATSLNGQVKFTQVTAFSGFVNETLAVNGSSASYFLNKDTGTNNGSSTTTFNIGGLSNAAGTIAHITLRVSKGATGSAINTFAYVQINGVDTIGLVVANGSGAMTTIKTFTVVYNSTTGWQITGAIGTY